MIVTPSTASRPIRATPVSAVRRALPSVPPANTRTRRERALSRSATKVSARGSTFMRESMSAAG